MILQCPIHNKPLARSIYEGNIKIDSCPECTGTWLDKGELEQIQEIRENNFENEMKALPDVVGKALDLALAEKEPAINCPVCKEQMNRREYGYCSQVLIDVCPSCQGVWLDKNELAMLEVFFEKSTMETPRARIGFFQSLVDFF